MYDELVKDLREISGNRAIPIRMAETAKEAARGNAYDDLNEMIGLASAKSVIIKALNYYKLQRSNAIRFIDTACFWDDFGKIRDLHYEGKPLLVKDVSPDIICSIQEYDRQIDRQKLLILQQMQRCPRHKNGR